MAQEHSGGLRLVFDDDNSVRDTITQYTIQSSYMTSTDAFDFTLYDEDRESLRKLELRPVTLHIDDRPLVIGRIERTTKGGEGTSVRCDGRDYISELVECDVDPTIKLNANMTVIEAVSLAVATCGITNVFAGEEIALRNIRTGRNIQTKKTPPGFKTAKLEDYKPKADEGIYEFCNRILARNSATLQPTDRRDSVVLSAPQYKQSSTFRIRRYVDSQESRANTVQDSEATRDFSSFPTFTLFKGKHVKSTDKTAIKIDMSDLVEAFSGELADILRERVLPGRIQPKNATASGFAQLYRLDYVKDDDAKTVAQLERTAKRRLAEHLKETLRYTATISGHTDPESGATWAPDTMVEVYDEICDVFEPLWIESVTYSYARGSGTTTRIEAWRPDSFQIGD